MSIKARKPGDGKSTGSKSYAANLTDSAQVNLRESHSVTVPTSGRTLAIPSDRTRSEATQPGAISGVHLDQKRCTLGVLLSLVPALSYRKVENVRGTRASYSKLGKGTTLLLIREKASKAMPSLTQVKSARSLKRPGLNAGAGRASRGFYLLANSDNELSGFAITEIFP